ncbi:hypothetical protein [Alterinioella nitratireducens]|uniref:hypothetical protein n=1 Tax=Alterinioella nitratireducens TaxID=2735915 RepID=UPI000C5B349A|nr:hypothetical protein [Nioella sp.]
MGFENVALLILMVLVGLAFRPLGWLAAIAGFLLFVELIAVVEMIWPFLLLGLVVIVAAIAILGAVAAKQDHAQQSEEARSALADQLRKQLEKRR